AYTHYDLGYTAAATIGNLVWSDTNNNGVKDRTEVGLAGVTVRLLDAAGKVEVATTTTGGDGAYLFTGLLPGTYVVEI
uniref:SdrD B-like domain-containing protein n=1 Tax=Salmonella sp. SAL4435 TaxID=3159890 RepID=UPI00397E363C